MKCSNKNVKKFWQNVINKDSFWFKVLKFYGQYTFQSNACFCSTSNFQMYIYPKKKKIVLTLNRRKCINKTRF